MADDPEILASEAARLPKLPANQFCADCDRENPDWASLNLGILLCIKCAGVHRNLGVHISKVRSLTLDRDCWDRNQLDFMYAVGNERARQIYEATCPCWYLRPTERNDSSIVRENWIRAKYERREFLADVKQTLAISVMPEHPREGFLWKRNKKQVWQKRYIMLHGRYLYYYKEPSQSYPSGYIDVCVLTWILPNTSDSNKRYVFECVTGNRTYPFGAESINDMLDWVHALKRAAAYYLTLLNPNEPASNGPEKNEVLKLSYGQIQSDTKKKGLLTKQGGTFRTWNKRLCFVTSSTLYYFKKENPADADLPEDGIPLNQAYITNGDTRSGKPHCVCIITPSRTYFLCALNDQEKAEWIAGLQQVVDKLNPQRLVDFSQMMQPEPIKASENMKDGDESD